MVFALLAARLADAFDGPRYAGDFARALLAPAGHCHRHAVFFWFTRATALGVAPIAATARFAACAGGNFYILANGAVGLTLECHFLERNNGAIDFLQLVFAPALATLLAGLNNRRESENTRGQYSDREEAFESSHVWQLLSWTMVWRTGSCRGGPRRRGVGIATEGVHGGTVHVRLYRRRMHI